MNTSHIARRSRRCHALVVPVVGGVLLAALACAHSAPMSAQTEQPAPVAPPPGHRMPMHQISVADSTTPGSAYVQASSTLAAGEYLTFVGGCGDCHTAQATPGDTTDRRFAGNPVGYRGPWGTSYAANLRLAVQHLSEDRWVSILKTHNGRPPMPWENLHHMNQRDLRAIYEYIRSLGPAGSPTPRAVPPGQEPTTPYIDFTPKQGS